MSLQKIVRSLEQLDRHHQLIKQKFSSKGKTGYVYSNCLLRDQLEDLRIFGHTHADTIQKFRSRHQASSHEIADEFVALGEEPVGMDKPVKRSQTAHRQVRKRNKILEIYTIDAKSETSSGVKMAPSSHSNSRLLSSKGRAGEGKLCLRKESIAKFRKQFSTHFEDNLSIAQQVSWARKDKQSSKTIIMERQDNSVLKGQGQKDNENVFSLTQHKQGLAIGKQMVELGTGAQMSYLRRLNRVIFQQFSTKYLSGIRKQSHGGGGWAASWRRLRELQGRENFLLLLVSVSTLNVYEIDAKVPEDALFGVLAREKIGHLFILKAGPRGEDELVYEEFVASKSLSLQFFSWPKQVFRYYLRRFMLLGGEGTSVAAIKQQEKQFYEDYQKVPHQFYRFIHEMKEKSYVFIDFKLKVTSGNLSELLEEGFKQIEARRLNWSKKGVLFERFQKENRFNRHAKQIYFYICSLISKQPSHPQLHCPALCFPFPLAKRQESCSIFNSSAQTQFDPAMKLGGRAGDEEAGMVPYQQASRKDSIQFLFNKQFIYGQRQRMH